MRNGHMMRVGRPRRARSVVCALGISLALCAGFAGCDTASPSDQGSNPISGPGTTCTEQQAPGCPPNGCEIPLYSSGTHKPSTPGEVPVCICRACPTNLCVKEVCVSPKGSTPNCLPCQRNTDCASGLCQGSTCYGGDVNGKCESNANCSGGNAPGFTAECVKTGGAALGDCICHKIPDAGPDGAPGCSVAVTPDIVSGSDPGGAGAAVTILAQNLDSKDSGNAVHFGATLAPIVELVRGVGQDATLLVRVPKGPTGTVPVKITTCKGDSASAPFPITATDAPNPTSFIPSTGPAGTLLTLTGTGFTGATQCDLFLLKPTIQHFLSTFTPTDDTSGTCMNNAVVPAGTLVYVGVKGASGTGFPVMQFTMQ